MNKDKIPAAMYIRMSTEHQKYSPENQAAAIREYADHHNYEIIRTYTDGGKSGLNIAGRAALQQMLSDVQSHQAEYKAILVLDVIPVLKLPAKQALQQNISTKSAGCCFEGKNV